jgi:hypothetical protein
LILLAPRRATLRELFELLCEALALIRGGDKLPQLGDLRARWCALLGDPLRGLAPGARCLRLRGADGGRNFEAGALGIACRRFALEEVCGLGDSDIRSHAIRRRPTRQDAPG